MNSLPYPIGQVKPPFSQNGNHDHDVAPVQIINDPALDLSPSASAKSLSAEEIAALATTVATTVKDFEFSAKLKTLHLTLDGVIADIPVSERATIEKALAGIFSVRTARDFLAKIPAPKVGPVFKPLSFDDLSNMPPKEWSIDKVIGPGDIGMIYGQPGSGKSFLVINMIIAACTGSQWATRFDIERPLNVAYCAGEGVSGLPARFKAAAAVQRITSLPNFSFFPIIPQLFGNDEDPNVANIRQFVTDWKAQQEQGQAEPLDLLFIDTLSTAAIGAKENDNTDMGLVVACCRRAAIELGCAVILVHHTNKAGTAERGATALRGAADCMIEVRRIGETGTKAVMSCSKLKDGEAWKDQTFELHNVEQYNSACVLWDEPSDGQRALGKKAADKVVLQAEMERYLSHKFLAKSLAEVIGQADGYTRKLLNELTEEGICQRELSKPDDKESNRNPWVYFISATQGGLS